MTYLKDHKPLACDGIAKIPNDRDRQKVRTMITLLAGNPELALSELQSDGTRKVTTENGYVVHYAALPTRVLEIYSVEPRGA